MNHDDLPSFEAELSDLFELLSHGKTQLSTRVVTLWFEALAPYPLAAVSEAMKAHLRAPDTGRTLPIPADVIKQINAAVANDGRLGADEAWSIAVQAADEGATVAWTAEIAEAWGQVRHVMALGDEVGARVGFRDTYNRIVHDARCARRPVEWVAALGADRARQLDGIRRAVELGRLPMAMLAELQALPAPHEPATLMLTGPASDGVTYDADGRRGPTVADRERWIRTMVALSQPRPSAAEVDAARTAELKAVAADLVAKYPPAGEGVH